MSGDEQQKLNTTLIKVKKRTQMLLKIKRVVVTYKFVPKSQT